MTHHILSSLENIPNLTDVDAERNIPSQTNFKNYSTHDFHNDEDISNSFSDKSFSVLHLNIRSLQANALSNFLCDLQYQFSLIGLTETKQKTGKDQTSNTTLPGYNFISQPSESHAGGSGFFIQENINFDIRRDLSKVTEDFESLWIEVDNVNKRNIVCGVIYRHPNSNVDNFLSYIFDLISKIHKENKFCIIMGDFNINLLNSDSNSMTENFLNTLGSYFFHPQILQPTRITNHSATLIENIFFN